VGAELTGRSGARATQPTKLSTHIVSALAGSRHATMSRQSTEQSVGHAEGIAAPERVVLLSRAPVFVGMLGLGYARGGRADDARHLLREIEDRGARGEYIPPHATLPILVGLGDLPGIRAAFAKCIAEITSPISFHPCRYFLDAFRTDPEIHRLHVEMFGR